MSIHTSLSCSTLGACRSSSPPRPNSSTTKNYGADSIILINNIELRFVVKRSYASFALAPTDFEQLSADGTAQGQERRAEKAVKQKKLNQSKNYTSYERVPLSCFGMGRAQKDARMLFSPAPERPAETR